jgi:ribosomal protein L37AE/L43A
MSAPDRQAPLYCPYCGDEDLRPHEASHGAWECRSCARVFALKFLGLSATLLEVNR